MNSGFIRTNNEGGGCIDPRLLDLHAGWIDKPYHSSNLPPIDPHDDLELENHTVSSQGRFDGADIPVVLQELEDTIDSTAGLGGERVKLTRLRAEAPIFIPNGPSKPSLSLETRLKKPENTTCVRATPTTPKFRVQYFPGTQYATGSHVRPGSRSRTRVRSHSSPTRRPIRSSSSSHERGTALMPRQCDVQGSLLSPDQWLQHSYNVGDHVFRHHVRIASAVQSTQHPRPTPSTTSISDRSNGPYYCDYNGCKEPNKPWKILSDLRKHQKTHLPKDQRPHACLQCPQRFRYPKDVRRHMKTHKDEPVICQSCGKSLSRDDNLQRHMASQHGTEQDPASFDGSSAGSPSASTMSAFSPTAYSDTAPSSPPRLSPPIKAASATQPFQQILHANPFAESGLLAHLAPPMLRWYSNGPSYNVIDEERVFGQP